MSEIPVNIKKEHLLKAIQKIDKDGIPLNAHSSTYDVSYNGNLYPPKLVVSWANIYINNEELTRSDFSGGKDTECFMLLKKEGFEVIRKANNSYWFLGASFEGGNDDKTEEFCRKGIWYQGKFLEDVKRIKPGDNVAIKSSYTRKNNLPFDANGRTVSVMGIKAVGTVISNPGDGKSLKVSWTLFPEVKEWYFYTVRTTVWEVKEGEQYADDLIAFTFEGQPQNYDYFRNEPYWGDRFGDSGSMFDIYPHLIKFIEQANDGGLKTRDLLKSAYELKVKTSFGQGVSAKIPWISFLGENQKTSEGIYPVYLYTKEVNCLILCYGISEENPPLIQWPEMGEPTYAKYLKDEYGFKTSRYGNSKIFKAYDLSKELIQDEVNKDLCELIVKYKSVLVDGDVMPVEPKSSGMVLEFDINNFIAILENSGLIFSDNKTIRFISALQTKPFVILTGLSGSGKTKLAEAFSLWVSESKDQYCMVAVGADWTNREPLLGFPNALEKGEYVKPDTGALDLILRAQDNPDKPYFLILDEMNMSHVERYFADFLSAMESVDGVILLRPDTADYAECDVPAEVFLLKNIFIIGTVNIDETTYMFSPKVLDRANVIEFRVSEAEMQSFFSEPKELNMEALTYAGVAMGESFVAKAKEKGLVAKDLEKDLMPFFNQLQEAGSEFGYRTASEISRFVKICSELADHVMTKDEVIDAAIMQKLLPKVHGSRNKIEKILKELGKLCLASSLDDPFAEGAEVKYPLSYEKLKRMHKRVISDGFTSFAEA